MIRLVEYPFQLDPATGIDSGQPTGLENYGVVFSGPHKRCVCLYIYICEFMYIFFLGFCLRTFHTHLQVTAHTHNKRNMHKIKFLTNDKSS